MIKNQSNILYDLPTEILVTIYSFMKAKDFVNVLSCSKYLRSTMNKDSKARPKFIKVYCLYGLENKVKRVLDQIEDVDMLLYCSRQVTDSCGRTIPDLLIKESKLYDVDTQSEVMANLKYHAACSDNHDLVEYLLTMNKKTNYAALVGSIGNHDMFMSLLKREAYGGKITYLCAKRSVCIKSMFYLRLFRKGLRNPAEHLQQCIKIGWIDGLNFILSVCLVSPKMITDMINICENRAILKILLAKPLIQQIINLDHSSMNKVSMVVKSLKYIPSSKVIDKIIDSGNLKMLELIIKIIEEGPEMNRNYNMLHIKVHAVAKGFHKVNDYIKIDLPDKIKCMARKPNQRFKYDPCYGACAVLRSAYYTNPSDF